MKIPTIVGVVLFFFVLILVIILKTTNDNNENSIAGENHIETQVK